MFLCICVLRAVVSAHVPTYPYPRVRVPPTGETPSAGHQTSLAGPQTPRLALGLLRLALTPLLLALGTLPMALRPLRLALRSLPCPQADPKTIPAGSLTPPANFANGTKGCGRAALGSGVCSLLLCL